MSDNEKIDFSALDPARAGERWEQRLASVARQGLLRYRRSRSVPQQLLTWSRPALAMAAALAVLVWTGFLFHDAPSVGGKSADPAYLLSGWALGDDMPSSAEVLEALGGEHVHR